MQKDEQLELECSLSLRYQQAVWAKQLEIYLRRRNALQKASFPANQQASGLAGGAAPSGRASHTAEVVF